MKLLLLFLLMSCGGNEVEKEYVSAPPPPKGGRVDPGTGGRGGNQVATFSEIQPILKESCGGASCHAGASFIQSENALRQNSQVLKRIQSDSMPPSYAGNYYLWQDGVRKKKILEFLSR